MLKHIFLFIFCGLIVSAVNAQKLQVKVNYVTSNGPTDNSLIYYDTKKLSWNDFIATPDAASEAAAITSAGFGFAMAFKTSGNNAELNLNVYCNFDKKKSWVKSNRKTDVILNHEQKHFDISFLCTMLFIQKLRKAEFTMTNYKTVLTQIYTESASYMYDLQNKYDTETSNGRITDKQEEWNKKIAEQITSLKTEEKI